MSNLSFIVLVVLICCTAGVIIEYLRTRGSKEDSTDNAELIEQLERLEERLRVLERIVTEKKYDLRKEIDSL